MDPAPPDPKRTRLSSWPSSASPHGVSLPRPHPQHPTTLPPPHHPAPSPYNSYPPPRHPEPHSSAPQTPVHLPSSAPQPHPPPPPPPHPESDRRHHEQEPYAPMHDHYQQQHHPPHHHPPPSPAHGHYPTYPQRDHQQPTIVKREGPEDPRRPNSTGHASDGPAPAPHHTPNPHHTLPPPPMYSDAQGRHMSYENGGSVPPTPNPYRPPSGYPAPPTPVSAPTPYEPHSSYAPPSENFYSVYSSSSQAKKKNTRASQACDQCRQLKAKCDETKPCKTCRDKGTECRYRDPIPKATDKAQADILEGITVMQNTLQALTAHFGRMDERLTKMETNYAHQPTTVVVKPELAELKHRSSFANGSSNDHYYSSDRDAMMGGEIPRLPMMAEDEIEAEPGPPVPPGEPAIPINHTTLAGLLLEWPSVRDITKYHVERSGIRFISEFPISQEQNRGPLIVHGRGEDSRHSRHTRETADHGNIDMGDDSSDTASPSPAADYGQLSGLSPQDAIEYRGGALGYDGNPDFSEIRVWSYVESFKEHILKMHPIIQPKVINSWVRHFLDTLPAAPQRSSKAQPARSTFAVGNSAPPAGPEPTGSKRKRSPERDDGPPTPAPAKSGKPNRSVHSALVLTVLALGKICQHRDGIPDVVHTTSDPVPHGSPVVRNGVPPSPSQSSPPGYSSHSHSSQPSPHDQTERGSHSRRPSIHGPTSGGIRSGYHLKKNYDVIPGLEYFAYATDILGNYSGAYSDMKVVYACIFAGLYHGQLGRPLESFAYIHQASHKLQVIMRPSLDKMRNFKRQAQFIVDPKYNQLALAFWTCLQLEADLIAELQLPPSGLLSYEDDMPHPNMSLLEGSDQAVLDSYPGQLYLRTHLNSIHRMFYAPEEPNKVSQDDRFKNVRVVADAVSGMQWVAPSFAFREDDPPADNILAARLRAKYWGAQVITYRPFIRQILQFSHSINHHPSSPNPPWSEFRDGIIAPTIHPNAKALGDIDPAVVELAKKGIKALVESTRAFHGLGDERPIITNIFGTAHAQWGNLLVLSAAYRDPVLKSSVNGEELEYLFNKTIQFFHRSATATSSLRIDMYILEGLRRDLFSSIDPRAGSSFSSNSMHTPKLATATSSHMARQISDSSSGPAGPSSAPPTSSAH